MTTRNGAERHALTMVRWAVRRGGGALVARRGSETRARAAWRTVENMLIRCRLRRTKSSEIICDSGIHIYVFGHPYRADSPDYDTEVILLQRCQKTRSSFRRPTLTTASISCQCPMSRTNANSDCDWLQEYVFVCVCSPSEGGIAWHAELDIADNSNHGGKNESQHALCKLQPRLLVCSQSYPALAC